MKRTITKTNLITKYYRGKSVLGILTTFIDSIFLKRHLDQFKLSIIVKWV